MTTMIKRQMALYGLFFAPGLGISSWVTRTPAIREMVGASTAEMGLVLFGLSVGSMIGILSAGPLVARVGARWIVGLGAVSVVISMPVIGLGALGASSVAVATGLGFFGVGMGSGEIAMNLEGARVERVILKSFLPRLHGFFSLGTVIGATAGIVFTAASVSVVLHLFIIGALTLVVLVFSIGQLPSDTGRTERERRDERMIRYPENATAVPLWKDTRLVLLGVIVLALALAEGTANDWLPLVMVDGHGFDPALGSAVYAVFAAAMTVGRFCGGSIVRVCGRSWVLAGSGLFAAIGLLLVSVADSQILAAISVVLWGLGASLGFPVALSAAGDSGPNATSRVSLVSTVGYLAILVGPPALGLLGDSFGLRGALLAPMAIVVLAAFLSPAAGTTKARTETLRSAEKCTASKL